MTFVTESFCTVFVDNIYWLHANYFFFRFSQNQKKLHRAFFYKMNIFLEIIKSS